MTEELRDELERKGDSLLDEESALRPPQCWDLQMGASGIFWIRLSPALQEGKWEALQADEARNLANAILSELEIAQREGDGEW